APSELGRLDPSRLTSRTATLNAWCNTGTAQLTVQADPLENTSAADTLPGFERRIDFTATATATGPETAAKDSTLTDGPGAAVNGGVGTELLVSFSDVSTPADARLLAG